LNGNSIFVSGHKPWIHEVHAKNIHDFTNDNVKLFKVVDHIRIKDMGPSNLTILKNKERFVQEVHLIKGKFKRQTAQAISLLTLKQLNNDEFSPVYSRIKVKAMLKKAGIRGRKKGIETRPGFTQGQRYKPPVLEFEKREIYPVDKDEQNKQYLLQSKDSNIQHLMELMRNARSHWKVPTFSPSWNNSGGNTTV